MNTQIHEDEGKGISACRICGADVETDGAQQDVVCEGCEEDPTVTDKFPSASVKCNIRGAANCKACSDETCSLRVAEAD